MAEIAEKHLANRVWDSVMERIRVEMARRQVHPSRVVVLVPYAQLMQEARNAWLRGLMVRRWLRILCPGSRPP
jgi:hypothetical protein